MLSEVKGRLAGKSLFTLATEENAVRPINGPGGLPYIALFTSEAAAKASLPDGANWAEVKGDWAADVATKAGWGIGYQIRHDDQAVLGFGQVCDMLSPPDENAVAAARTEPDFSKSMMIAEPNESLVSTGMRNALAAVAASEEGVARAWLLLLVGNGGQRLALAVEQQGALDGQALVGKLTWATPAAKPVALVVAGDEGAFALKDLKKRTPLYQA